MFSLSLWVQNLLFQKFQKIFNDYHMNHKQMQKMLSLTLHILEKPV